MSGFHPLCDLIEGTVTQTQREDRLSANKACPPTCPFVDSLSYAESRHSFSQKRTSFSIPHTSRLQMSPWSFRRDFSKPSSTCQYWPYLSFLHEHSILSLSACFIMAQKIVGVNVIISWVLHVEYTVFLAHGRSSINSW